MCCSQTSRNAGNRTPTYMCRIASAYYLVLSMTFLTLLVKYSPSPDYTVLLLTRLILSVCKSPLLLDLSSFPDCRIPTCKIRLHPNISPSPDYRTPICKSGLLPDLSPSPNYRTPVCKSPLLPDLSPSPDYRTPNWQ
jgi:hypothetical protein